MPQGCGQSLEGLQKSPVFGLPHGLPKYARTRSHCTLA
jgi:hypothetical protein